jgi:signal peptidase I
MELASTLAAEGAVVAPTRVEGMATPAGTHPAWRYFAGVLTTATTVLIVIIACVAIVIAAATHFSATKGQYTVFGHPVMVVLSGSMAPVIRTGDLVIDNPVTAAEASNLHVGQIISFRSAPDSTTVFTHRIVGVTTTGDTVSYITKGDANNAPDADPRPAKDVIGLFQRAIPRGGYILNALHQPLVLGLLLAAPVLWFIAGPLFEVARAKDEPASRDPADDAGKAEAEAP